MAKLGAPLNQVESAISLISNDKDDSLETHPSRGKRLNAIRLGYNRGFIKKENKTIYVENKNKLSAEEFFVEGLTLKNQKKYLEALVSFKMSVKINSDFMEGYFNIGLMNWLLHNNLEAINNFTKALKFKSDYKPSVPILYLSRGRAKYDEELYSSAIMDLNKSIELRADDYEAYVFRAKCKIQLGESEEACLDLKKAENLGYLEANQLIRYYCQVKNE